MHTILGKISSEKKINTNLKIQNSITEIKDQEKEKDETSREDFKDMNSEKMSLEE